MAEPLELPDEVKRFIVTRLACFERPSEVAAAVKEEFAAEVTRQRVEAYDPTKVAGKALSKEYRALFAEARALYLADTATIGIASKVFRLRTLERLAMKAESVGNAGMVAQLLEQAAKEMGGAYTNRRELTGADGKPIETTDKTPKATPSQVMDELTAIFGGAVPLAAAKDQAGNDRVVRKGSSRGGRKKPGASKGR